MTDVYKIHARVMLYCMRASVVVLSTQHDVQHAVDSLSRLTIANLDNKEHARVMRTSCKMFVRRTAIKRPYVERL